MKGLFLLAGSSFLFLSSCHLKNISPPTAEMFPKNMVVQSSVADLRSNKSDRNDKYEYDDKQETQLLEGEMVLVHEIQGEWARVECVEQMEYTHQSKWEGYPGWIRIDQLTDDSSKQKFPLYVASDEKPTRDFLLAQARRHVGARYLWGGRSLHDPTNKKVLTGVDCSGLVNWSFRQVGRKVPRDAHEQFMKAHRLERQELKPGDLFFLAKKEKPEKIVHVGFISGDETLLEAPQSGEVVREMTFRARFGKDLKDLKNGDEVGERIIYFGTLLNGGV